MKKAMLPFLFFVMTNKMQAQFFTIHPRSSLIMRGPVFLVVKNAALINNSTVSNNSGTVQFNGYKDTTISFLSGTQATILYNLTVDKMASGTALKSAVAVRNVLGVYGGILYADSNLTLRSDANLTARVDIVPASAGIVGKAMVERYYPARRAWRLITAPLTNTPSVFNTWQNKGVYVAAVNTCVSGPNPTGAGGNGLDPSIQNNASMKTWDPASQALLPVLNTHIALSPGNNGSADNTGYFLFVRGDRNFNNFYIPNTNVTTLCSNGQLQVGTQNFAASPVAAGFTLIGNPFASPVDFNLISRSNLVKRFYVWDPALNLVGGYVMLDDLNNDGVFIKSVSSSLQNNHLQSSQAFFVETVSDGAAAISFSETCKSGGNNNALFRPQLPAPRPTQTIRVLLNLPAADGSIVLADEVLLECNSAYSDTVDLDDALKFTNINENIGWLRGNKMLTAERRSLLKVTDTLFLKLNRTTQRRYQFKIIPEQINEDGLLAWLEDRYLNSSRSVSLSGASVCDFDIDTNAASAAPGRFRIVFKQAQVLPVTILQLNAYQHNENIAVEWKVTDEINIVKYEIERSADGSRFSGIGTITASVNTGSQNQYQFLDQQPLTGNNFYRIKYVDADGQWKYTVIVKVIIAGNGIAVYPNPVTDHIIHLQFNHQAEGKYIVRLLNQAGQLVYETLVLHIGSTGTYNINPKNNLSPGMYEVEITGENNLPFIQKIIVLK